MKTGLFFLTALLLAPLAALHAAEELGHGMTDSCSIKSALFRES
jgi:hypothetical protein